MRTRTRTENENENEASCRVHKCGCVLIGYPRKKVIRSQSAKNGLILYEDFELRNEVTVTFPIEGIFQKYFYF